MIHYFDASALVKRYVVESGSDAVIRWLREGQAATSRFTLTEIAAAVSRRCREGDISKTNRDKIVAAVLDDSQHLLIVELTPEVVALSSDLVGRHSLRAGDAVQLASCLLLHEKTRGCVAFIAFDKRLNLAANSEGIQLLSPPL